jgi:DNA sulfur modification protein DndD
MQMEAPLDQFRTQLAELKSRIGHAGKDISRDSKRLSEIEKNGQSIDGQLTGYDTGKIAEWHRQRVSLEDSRSQNRENLGRFRADHSRALVSVSSLKKELAEELGRENKAKRLATRRRFCSRALEVLEKTCESIMAETRTGIQTSTKKHFFDLAWKKQTFGDVEIRDDYSINLIHSMGYPCLGSLSAGERELLALSFTLALHETSGFDSPILIDTPVARISDELRANFAQVLARVGKKKQIILLFTPAEYSTEVSSQLDEYAARRYELKLGQDEQEAKAKVL